MQVLPRTPSRGPARPTATGQDQGPASAAGEERILIVEDEYLVAMDIETALSEAGFVVVGTAARASEAVRLAKETRPHLVVMDVRLAGSRDGIDAAIEIYNATGIRCIIASAHAAPELHRRAAAAAPLAWIAKPYQAGALIALIRDLLREPRQ
jgi:DNA-binding NarL/FixJ family response regulator